MVSVQTLFLFEEFSQERFKLTGNEKIPMLIQRLRISNVILMFSIQVKRNILTK